MRDALDFSFSPPVPALVAAQGFDLLGYTGSARVGQDYYDECRARGIAFTFIQETTSERAQEGWNAGLVDAQYADRRASERGHPYSAPIVYVVSDGSRDNPSWNGELIADYGAAIATQSARPFMFYGNRYAVDHACAGARRVGVNVYGYAVDLRGGPGDDGGWLPATWNFDGARDPLRQNIGYYTAAGGTCDLNTTHHDYLTPSDGGFLMALTDDEQHEVLDHVRAMARDGVPIFGLPNLFESLDSLTRSGVPELGLPNVFDSLHKLSVGMATLLAAGGGDVGELTPEQRAQLTEARDNIDAVLAG